MISDQGIVGEAGSDQCSPRQVDPKNPWQPRVSRVPCATPPLSSTPAEVPRPANSCRSGPRQSFTHSSSRTIRAGSESRSRTNGATIARHPTLRRNSNEWAGFSKTSAITWITSCRTSIIAPPSRRRLPATSAIRPGHRQPARRARARAATGGSCRTCQHTDLGDRPAHDICRASAHAGGLQHDFAWLRRIL